MKRLLFSLILIMCLSLGYVQQRVVLVTMGYKVENLRHFKEDLLDQHRILHYNVLALQSPVILSQRLARRDVQLAPPQQVEVLPRQVNGNPVVHVGEGRLQKGPVWFQGVWKLAAGWLDNGRQAEAEPVLEGR